ncbi:nucleotide kinase domain-containing protein [Sporomusa aerivorans]|uniref:nucleotide kinase domain-containing protein n=1 Tax=Sporomusa aerivorans TaxID=204936 RepID=UPI00352A4F12
MKIEGFKPTMVYDTYWKFAEKRQDVFFNRIENKPLPWTEDKIIQKYKFTNAYRASDRVSQYLIKNVIYCKNYYSPEDQCFRILFFKLFNKIETWEYMENALGEISYRSYSYKRYNTLLTQKLNNNERIYSAAYIMPTGKGCFGFSKKHQNNLKLLEQMMKSGLPTMIAKSKSLQELFEILISYPSLGSFLAFQYAIDINYSELCDFDEMSFVVAGPGAQNGIIKCFGELNGYKYEDIIKYVAEHQEIEFEKRGLKFKTLFGRKLHLIDCQNLFCETDKYARIAHPDIGGINERKRIKQQYINHNLESIEYFYPPKWGINNCIDS